MDGLPETSEDLVENFDLFDGWEDRYAYLIDLGRKLPPMDDADKTDANKVQGCMSQVWFTQQPDPEGRLRWAGDSDAAIVRGLIAVLHVLYDGVTPEEAEELDVEGVFGQIGLERHLSMNRRNGFYAMVSRLRQYAGHEG